MTQAPKAIDALPDKLLQVRIRSIIRSPLVLSLVHCAIHASLEERTHRCIGATSREFIEFIDITIEVAPNEGRVAFSHPGTELELLADKKHSLFIS